MAEEQQPTGNTSALGTVIQLFIVITVLVVTGWLIYFVFFMESAEQKVVNDALEKYRIVSNSGDKIATCNQMDNVVSAYLYAKDESKYNEWRNRQKAECPWSF